MKAIFAAVAFLSAICWVMAGDGADGPNRYEADFNLPVIQYQMTDADHRWSASLLKKLKEPTKPVHFTRTDLPIVRDGKAIQGLIYRCIESPQCYYVSEGDVILDLKRHLIYSPGSGGFSMHSPQSRNFIVCLNIQSGGVPFLRHSEINQGKIWWFSTQEWKRLENW